jgi:serine/threonine protein kinase
VLDFGLAKFLAADAEAATVTATGVIVGTLHYMAPEQLRGAPVAPSWDLWAIAVMAYEMLSGALPFPAGSPVAYQTAVLAGRVTPIGDHLPEATTRLDAFFARALAADAAVRRARAPILASDLADALGPPA